MVSVERRKARPVYIASLPLTASAQHTRVCSDTHTCPTCGICCMAQSTPCMTAHVYSFFAIDDFCTQKHYIFAHAQAPTRTLHALSAGRQTCACLHAPAYASFSTIDNISTRPHAHSRTLRHPPTQTERTVVAVRHEHVVQAAVGLVHAVLGVVARVLGVRIELPELGVRVLRHHLAPDHERVAHLQRMGARVSDDGE